MFPEHKNNLNKANSNKTNWRPSASIKNLKHRAKIIAHIRDFFAKLKVLEVDTPLLAHAAVTDPYLQAFCIKSKSNLSNNLYLQTSPEYAMKRLLCAGSGPIYQICKAFRDEPCGPIHQTEFTMLEWYQPNYNYHQLMDETADFITSVLLLSNNKKITPIKITYQQIFQDYLDFNPHTINYAQLYEISKKYNLNNIQGLNSPSKDDLLMLLFNKIIEPDFSNTQPVFIYDYPESQAALANTYYPNSNNNNLVAKRFELYYQGLELANGYDELCDPKELLKRFEKDLQIRAQQNIEATPIDHL